MINRDADQIDENANESLEIVNEMRRAGVRRAAYPKWFFAVIAILIFLAFANVEPVSVSDFPFFIIVIILYKVVHRRLGVVPLKDRRTEWGFVGGVFVLSVLFVVTTYLTQELGIDWLATIAGAVVAATYYWIKVNALEASTDLTESASSEE